MSITDKPVKKNNSVWVNITLVIGAFAFTLSVLADASRGWPFIQSLAPWAGKTQVEALETDIQVWFRGVRFELRQTRLELVESLIHSTQAQLINIELQLEADPNNPVLRLSRAELINDLAEAQSKRRAFICQLDPDQCEP